MAGQAEWEKEVVYVSEMVESLNKWYLNQLHRYPDLDGVTQARLAMVALTTYGAVVGVDVNIRSDQFLKVAEACFNQAKQNAPKFG